MAPSLRLHLLDPLRSISLLYRETDRDMAIATAFASKEPLESHRRLFINIAGQLPSVRC